MSDELRALNEEGRQQYREWLEKLRDNPSLPVPVALLDDPACAFAPVAGLQLPPGPFATKLDLAARLLPLIEQVEKVRVPEDRWPGVWDGLALAYFDEICPPGASGTRKVGEIERYIWDSRHIRFYKHRVAAPVTLFRVHREHSIVFLCGAPSVLSDYEIQVCSRQDWMSCVAVGHICCELYWDPIKRATKRGGMSKTKPGALFHLVRVLQHLERTFDLQGMDGSAVSLLLPEGFKSWLPEKELFDLNSSASSRVQEVANSSYERRAPTNDLSPPDNESGQVRMDHLRVGDQYTREQLAEIWGYASYHALARGVVTPRDTNLIILFVTESSAAAETSQYVNVLGANSLAWEGPADHFAEDRIVTAGDSGDEIHVFYREVHRSAFRYLGRVQVRSFTRNTDRPSRFVFGLSESVAND